jgi:hypothetical protein
MHCHIFSHAEDGMISELVVTGNVLEHNERPQMTIDNVDVTGIRGRTATASGTYADPDGDPVTSSHAATPTPNDRHHHSR